jgi:hypothetical protein
VRNWWQRSTAYGRLLEKSGDEHPDLTEAGKEALAYAANDDAVTMDVVQWLQGRDQAWRGTRATIGHMFDAYVVIFVLGLALTAMDHSLGATVAVLSTIPAGIGALVQRRADRRDGDYVVSRLCSVAARHLRQLADNPTRENRLAAAEMLATLEVRLWARCHVPSLRGYRRAVRQHNQALAMRACGVVRDWQERTRLASPDEARQLQWDVLRALLRVKASHWESIILLRGEVAPTRPHNWRVTLLGIDWKFASGLIVAIAGVTFRIFTK